MPRVAFLILAFLIVVGKFVDRVVCQVHVAVVNIAPVGSLVRLSAKSSEGHLMHKNAQWIHAIQQDVDAEVVL